MLSEPKWPIALDEMLAALRKDERRTWLEPKSGDLVHDVAHLCDRASEATNRGVRAIYARSTIVMGAAVIEAITNDALVTILELLSDTIPFECVKELPWCCFRGLSTTRIKRLLTRGSFRKKRDYLLNRIERAGGNPLEDTTVKEINQLISYRNRIVHMNFLNDINRYRPVLNASQTLHLAKMARDCAHDYVAFITDEFSEMRLPIRTVRPLWYLDSAEDYLQP